jgi:hypothetical protein
MSLSDHERPLSEHERRVFCEIELEFSEADRSRRRRRRRCSCKIVLFGFCLGTAIVIALAAVGLLSAPVAALLTGAVGAVIGALWEGMWTRNNGLTTRRVRRRGRR